MYKFVIGKASSPQQAISCFWRVKFLFVYFWLHVAEGSVPVTPVVLSSQL